MAHSKPKPCLFPDCGKRVFARGYCSGHAAQVRKGRELSPLRQPRPDAANGFVWCCRCKQFRPDEDFGWDKERNEPKRECRPCIARRMREYNAANRERIMLRVTLKKWGLTEAQYLAMFAAQQHRCAICGSERREWRTLAVDHCHDTGIIRGLLCQDCNMGMGQFADRPELLEAAAAYLRAGGVIHDPALVVPPGSKHDRRSAARDAARARS